MEERRVTGLEGTDGADSDVRSEGRKERTRWRRECEVSLGGAVDTSYRKDTQTVRLYKSYR